jgi:hypothetical protein
VSLRNDYPEMLALEPRIMFDGALAVDAVDVTLNYKVNSIEAERENDVTSSTNVKRIIFIDSNIQTSSSFNSDLDAASEIFTLDPEIDGVQQISEHLAGRQGVESIHIISHGSEGQINIGNTLLNNENLSSYGDQLTGIGEALSDDGDILLYGCDVANSAGRDFIATIASVTGADVAGSNNLTGSIDAGGDWLLEVESGPIESDTNFFSQYSGFSGLLTTPNVPDGGKTGYITDAEAVAVSPGMNITNGGDYGGGGSLTVAVTSADTSETLSLTKVSSATTANNVVSVVGSSLYLGSGGGSNVIGSIDGTNNGENGNSLQINFLSDSFSNASFETGDLTGWTADTATQIDIGTTAIAGITTPSDSSDPPNSGGDSDVPATKGTWTAPVNTVDQNHGSYSLQLKSASMTTTNGYDVVHGPSVYSDIFAGENGQTISFDWRALGGGDAYDVFGYIVNTDTNATTEILNETGTSAAGTTAWATANVTIPSTGNYRFVFISGTYDFTGLKGAGASLYIDNIQVFNAVDDAIVSQVAKLITYKTTATTLTEVDRAARTLTFTATDADGNAGNNTAIIYEDFPVAEVVNNPQQVSVVNKVVKVDVPATVIKINRDGLQTFVRDKGASGSSGAQMGFDPGVLGGEVSQESDAVPTLRNDKPQSQSQSSPSVAPRFNAAVIPQSSSSNLNDGGLSVLNGIKDPEISSLGIISFSIPIDAFAKSNNETMVALKASLPGNQTLPYWLKFDPVAGKFEGEVPEDFEGSIEVLVTATDQNGNEVTTSFVIEKDISTPATSNDEKTELTPPDVKGQILAAQKHAFSRSGFSQQLLLSRFSSKSLSQTEINSAIREINAAS